MTNTRSMTEGKPWVHIISFSLPVLLGSLLQQLYNTVDTIIVGNFASEEALSAVGTTGTLSFLFLAVAMGFSSGNGVSVAQFFGAKDYDKVKSVAATGVLFLMTLGLVSAVLGIALSYPAFKYFVDVPSEILDQTLLYFRIYAVGLIFQYGYNIFSSILRGVGDSKATLYFLLISSVLNIGLDLLFVAVFNWGVAGAAIATDISQAVSLIAAYIYMEKKYSFFRFSARDFTFNADNMRITVKIGFPISLQLIVVSFGLTVIQRAVNSFGQVMTATFTVGQRMEMYMNLPCNAMQTTLATYTGQNVGAGKMDRVRQGARQTVFISLIFTLIISALLWIFSKNIISLFGLGQQSALYCASYLKTIAFINIILACYVPLFGLYQGCGHSVFPMIVAFSALTTRVFVTYLLKDSTFIGYRIIWWNGMFGFSVGFIITWAYYFSRKWLKR